MFPVLRLGINATHLITCSFMAAPASLAVSKLFYPETEQSKTTIKDIKTEKAEESNVLDAAAKVTFSKLFFYPIKNQEFCLL